MLRPCTTLLCLVAMTLSGHAHGFVLHETEAGVAVRWEETCVPWFVHDDHSGFLTEELSEAVLLSAFQAWEDVPGAAVDFQAMGPTCHGTAGVGRVPGPQNVLLWRSEPGSWTSSHLNMALTYLTYDEETALIVDADIELNGVDYTYGTTGLPQDMDLMVVTLHEVGHLLGLDHSQTEDAVMYAKAKPGETQKRQLSDDDREALQANHGDGPGPGELCGEDALPSAVPLESYCLGDQEAGSGGDSPGCQSGGKGGLVPWLLGCGLLALLPWIRGQGC